MKGYYLAPRWSNEISDCSMPLTFDTYSVCSYDCLYCFSFFQKSHALNGYITKDVRAVNTQLVRRLFRRVLTNDKNMNKGERQFAPYIRERKVMQWGSMSDQFDETERKQGKTLELLRFFDEINYPLSFSTKATWWTEDDRYMALFAKHAHNWHVKMSIITSDKAKALKMERGVPEPAERFKAIKRLTDLGIHVTLRLRPFIIGLSEDYETTIRQAAAEGVESMTTEWFCMEARADKDLKARYAKMSEILGYDIHRFYMEQSPQMGYKRLTRAIKAPVIKKMRSLAHELGMRFHVSDTFCREYNDAVNCCGVPPEWNSQVSHLGGAILIAREKGEVHWQDIAPDCERLFDFKWSRSVGFNTANHRVRAV
jgi:DNA repair photolyase